MTAAAPRRNAKGLAVMRPMRTGTRRATRPSLLAMTCATGSPRRVSGSQAARDERGTRSRSPRPIAYRSARGIAVCRSDANDVASVAASTVCRRASPGMAPSVGPGRSEVEREPRVVLGQLAGRGLGGDDPAQLRELQLGVEVVAGAVQHRGHE